jgi:hypothetical protein
MVSIGQNREGKVVTGATTLKYPINFTSADSIVASDTVYVIVDCKQNYSHTQSVAITLDSISGAPSIGISLEGKTSAIDDYTEIVSAATWDEEADNPFAMVVSSANKYRYFKIKLISTGATQKAVITALTFTDTYQNTTTILATTASFSGDVLIGQTTANETTPSLTIKSDADSDAGGDTNESLIIDITPNATPTLATWGFTSTQSAGYTFDKNVTFNGGATLGAGDDLIGSATSDITIGTTAFTVAGATGNITSTGTFDNVVTNTAAGGDKALNVAITGDATAITGNLIGAGIVATNGTSSGVTSGVVYGIEAKARAATSANVGAAISRLDGVYASVDVKDKTATIIRAFEASLDGGAGGSSTEAVAFEAFNNSSAAQTSSYAFSANGGTAGGHKAYTADMRLQNGALINNSSTSLLTITEANVDVDGAFTASSFTSDGAVKLLDDQILTLGTTTTNAETKITAGFDETTTGIGYFRLGDMSNPQILKVNPGATVAGSIININHTLGAGDCDDLLGSYSKVNVIGSGDAGITIVGDAPRAYVGLTGGANNSVASQAYASQPWFRHQGTGAITAGSGLSAKCDVGADNFTASTINAIHAHITGTATVTGQFDGAMIEVYPDVTNLDNGLKIASDAGAVVANGLGFSGTFATAEISGSNAEIWSNQTDGVWDAGAANIRAATYNFGSAAAVGGSADAIAIDFTPNLASLVAGLTVTFVAEAANTGAATLAIDGGTAKAINESADNSALEANDIRSGSVVTLVYDGTQWQQTSQSGN